MKRVRSLRRRLTWTLIAVLGAALSGFSLLVHTAFTHAVTRQLDDALAAEARAAADLAELRDDGRWEVEPGEVSSLARSEPGSWFEVWSPSGEVLARSPQLSHGALPQAPHGPGWMRLPNGRRARLRVSRLSTGEAPAGTKVTVAVARDAAEVDEVTRALGTLLATSGALTLALAVLVALLGIERGLKPLQNLRRELEGIDASALDQRLDGKELPAELQPVIRTLNSLLSRLQLGFEREREFSAAVSHELRTPLAGLRSVLEVSSMRERPASEYQAAFRESLDIVRQLQRLVERLLLLARVEARQLPVKPEELALRDLVQDCFNPYEERATARSLRFENRISKETTLRSDRELFRSIVSNLLSNAAEYTGEGGWIRVEAATEPEFRLTVSDSGPPLPTAALDQVFERFVRLDLARSNSAEHSGIGLALVRSLAQALGMSVWAENRDEGQVAFVIASGRKLPLHPDEMNPP